MLEHNALVVIYVNWTRKLITFWSFSAHDGLLSTVKIIDSPDFLPTDGAVILAHELFLQTSEEPRVDALFDPTDDFGHCCANVGLKLLARWSPVMHASIVEV